MFCGGLLVLEKLDDWPTSCCGTRRPDRTHLGCLHNESCDRRRRDFNRQGGSATNKVLAKMFADSTLRSANGLFISPFKAQAKLIHSFFAKHAMESWMASTVHSQQGSEADIVIFDSVNTYPHD
ncbi:MAG: AAA domain-containing protein [Pirellulaceae bacterium]